MKLVPADTLPAPHEPMRMPTTSTNDTRQNDGLEWEDLMPEINRASEPSNMRWMLIDRESGAENGAITWAFTVGDRVKIRLVNEMESDHPMHHPFHVHGAGRFLVLSRDGEPESNLVWKDTVLVPAGQTVDILLDVSNPGLWMAHCHIAEHAQSGMMFSFNVSRRPSLQRRNGWRWKWIPVCGMRIDSEEAAGTIEHGGKTYYFCSQTCLRRLQGGPDLVRDVNVARLEHDGDGFTEDEVAERAGTTPERIRLLAELGILEPEDGTYPRRDVLRARFVLGLDAIGIDANAVADALASGDLTLGYVEIGGRRPPRSDRTFAELSDEIDIPFVDARTPLRRLRAAAPGARRVRARGGPAPPQVHPGALRRRGERRGDLAAGARVGRQRPTGRAVPEPLPAPLDRGAVPPARPPRQRSLRGGAQGGRRPVRVAPEKTCSAGSTGVIRRCSRPSTSSITSRPRSRTRECIGGSLGRSRPACSRTSPATRG